MTLSEQDKEIIKSENIGKITELLDFNCAFGNKQFLHEVQEYNNELLKNKKTDGGS